MASDPVTDEERHALARDVLGDSNSLRESVSLLLDALLLERRKALTLREALGAAYKRMMLEGCSDNAIAEVHSAIAEHDATEDAP